MALFDNCTNGSSWLHNFDPKKQIIWPSSIIVQMVPVGWITLILKRRESYRVYMALFDNCTNGSSWLHNFDPKKQIIWPSSIIVQMVPVGWITLILKSRESYRDYMAL